MFERTENFETYIAPARRYPSLWRLFAGLITLVLAYALFVAIGFGAMAVLLSGQTQNDIMNGLVTGADPTSMFVLLASFLGMALAAILACFWHERGFRSLIGSFSGAFQNFFRTLVITLPVFILSGVLISLVTDLSGIPQLPFTTWLLFLIPAIPLLIVQTGAEELVFRGYLTQQLAARFQSFLIWGIVPSILFGFAHYSSEFEPVVTGLVVLATGFFGFVAVDLTRITGNLGAAIAFHFTNNFFALFLIAIPDQLSGLALYLAPFTMNDTATIVPLIVVDILVIGTAWQILRRRLA